MKVIINPSKAIGEVNAPPSKSMAHRALICGALSCGSEINNLAFSKDISATLDCLKSLGAKAEVCGDKVNIGSLDLSDIHDGTELYCNESGSTLRFLLPMCLISGKRITLKGSKRLFERPLSVYESICREQGIDFQKGEDYVTVCGRLKSGNYRIPGDISSQFITGLLYVLPVLDGISIIEITGKFESSSYIDLTMSALSDFGIKITRVGSRFIIPGNQSYKSRTYTVEGDQSNAAFLDALGFLGGEVKVNGLNAQSLQGDRVYKNIFADMKMGKREFDLSDCPDLAPVLFALAATVGNIKFTGTKRLKIKESDRANAMKEELMKLGIPVTVNDDDVFVGSGALKHPADVLCGHNDHRIVMSLAVLLTLVGGEIEGVEAVSKSYPDFFDILKTLKVEAEVYDT